MSTPPSSSDHPVRKLISAPAAISTTSVLSESVHSLSARPASVRGRSIAPGRLKGIHGAFASRKNATSAPKPAAHASARAFFPPSTSPPASSPWIDLSVSAVAVPVGNGSCSSSMSCRLMGMAAKTPSAAMTANQTMMGIDGGRSLVTISSAPKAAMLPPPVMKPAPDATVVSALFSSMPSGSLVIFAAPSPLKTAQARMQAVRVTPIDQPVLKKT